MYSSGSSGRGSDRGHLLQGGRGDVEGGEGWPVQQVPPAPASSIILLYGSSSDGGSDPLGIEQSKDRVQPGGYLNEAAKGQQAPLQEQQQQQQHMEEEQERDGELEEGGDELEEQEQQWGRPHARQRRPQRRSRKRSAAAVEAAAAVPVAPPEQLGTHPPQPLPRGAAAGRAPVPATLMQARPVATAAGGGAARLAQPPVPAAPAATASPPAAAQRLGTTCAPRAKCSRLAARQEVTGRGGPAVRPQLLGSKRKALEDQLTALQLAAEQLAEARRQTLQLLLQQGLEEAAEKEKQQVEAAAAVSMHPSRQLGARPPQQPMSGAAAGPGFTLMQAPAVGTAARTAVGAGAAAAGPVSAATDELEGWGDLHQGGALQGPTRHAAAAGGPPSRRPAVPVWAPQQQQHQPLQVGVRGGGRAAAVIQQALAAAGDLAGWPEADAQEAAAAAAAVAAMIPVGAWMGAPPADRPLQHQVGLPAPAAAGGGGGGELRVWGRPPRQPQHQQQHLAASAGKGAAHTAPPGALPPQLPRRRATAADPVPAPAAAQLLAPPAAGGGAAAPAPARPVLPAAAGAAEAGAAVGGGLTPLPDTWEWLEQSAAVSSLMVEVQVGGWVDGPGWMCAGQCKQVATLCVVSVLPLQAP
jgi:hypothetical protein